MGFNSGFKGLILVLPKVTTSFKVLASGTSLSASPCQAAHLSVGHHILSDT